MLSIRTNQYKCYEIPSDDSKVKDLKRPVFAGYNIISHDADILTIDILLSSPLLILTLLKRLSRIRLFTTIS